ncbi:MAG: ATP-binding protein [Solirubrobacterales bacterium]
MLAELAGLASGWPLILSLALILTAQGVVAGRRRVALNEALHELRRPLQALFLAAPAAAGGEELTRQAVAALARLEREVNGEGAAAGGEEAVAVAPLLAAAVRRWSALARRAGTALSLGGGGDSVVVHGQRESLEQALDNLIVNGVEHGGSRVSVGMEVTAGWCRVYVRDSGPERGSRFARRGRVARPPRLAAALARLSGRRRRGHGLRVARRVAVAHGGRLLLRSRPGGTEAVLELPLAGAGEPV